MSGIYFEISEVRLKKYAATATGGARKTASVVRIELEIADAYALASVLRQLEDLDAEQHISDSVARQAARPPKPPRSTRQLAATPRTPLLPYHGDDI